MWLPFVLLVASSAANLVEQNCLLQTPQQTQITGQRLKLAAAIGEPVFALKSLSNISTHIVRTFEDGRSLGETIFWVPSGKLTVCY
eukprot:s2201_g3.t1